MKITNLVPKEWVITENLECVTLWFSGTRGGYNRKSFTFINNIVLDESFAEAIGLVMGDGDMHRREKRHFTFASKDIDLTIFILEFLRQRLNLKNKDISITIYCKVKKVDENMLKTFNVDISKIHFIISSRHNFPVTHIQVNGVVFRLVFERIFDTFIKSNFLDNLSLRRGFLRGLFAAEGCIGIKYKENYINQISFTLASKEKEFVNLLQTALSKENITFKTIERKNTLETVISNWKNYLKCWEISLFDRCERKKQSFLSIAKKSTVYVKVDPSDLNNLSNFFSQRELAKIIGSWQGNVCRILQGKILLSLKQVKVLEDRGISLSIHSLRVGNLTELPRESIRLFD